MAAKDIEVKVKYIPDTSALKSAMSGMSSIDFKTGNSNVKKELVAPVQAAMKEVNKALASGADSSTLLQLFQKVGKEADAAKTKASAMLSELNTVFNSSGNQKLLKDLEEYRKKISQTEKQIENWDKKFGNATMKQMKTDLYGTGKGGVAEARKEIASMEEQLKIGKQLTQQDEERLALLKKYVSTWNERQAATPKNELESQLSGYRAKESDILSQVQTPTQNVEETKRLTAIITQVGNAYGLSTQEINKLTAALKIQDDVVKKNKKELTKFGDIVTGTFLGTSIGNLFQTGIQRGIQFFKEYDETLTRTMMVTGMTREEVNGLTSSYNRLANQLSSTTKDVAAAQLVFYQQGLGTKEAMEMTEASIAISKTGGIEAAEAANRLTAAVRGYQLAANDAMDIADKMSALDAAAASSVDELTIAMQKSASQARMAGLDLDYYMAYLSTMQEVTREAPENIGTAMKSITSRMQEIRDIGKIEEDGTTFSNVAKALTSIGIAATDSSGQLRSLQDIMNELGPMWATLDRNHKAYIATTLAGNRQQSRFIALMDNYDRAMELVSVSQNASGESAKQLRAYNQGLEASFTALSNAWQQFATKLADSEVIKGVVDLLTDLIELFNKLPKGVTSTLIPMAALIKTFTTISKAGNLFKGFKDWGIEQLGLKDVTADMGSFNKTINSSIGLMSKWGNSIKKALDGWGNNVYISDTTEKIEDFTVAEKAATAAQTLSDPIQHSEALLNTEIAASAVGAKDAYLAYNQALTDNAVALGFNDTGQRTEIQQNIQKMIDEYNAATADVKASDEKITALEKKIEKARNRDIDKEVMTSSPSQARQYGQEYLYSIRESKDELLPDLIEKHKKKGQRITGDIQKDELNFALSHQNEIANYLKQQNEATIAEMEKNLDELYAHHNKLMNSQLKLKYEVDTQSKKLFNSKEMKRVVSLNQLDTIKKNKSLSFANMKTVVGDKNLTNMEKMSAFTSKLNIGAGLIAGSLTQMGASFLGLDDDMSSALSTSVGLATTFGKFAPPWGAIIGASIGVVKFAFDKMWPSVEKTQQKLAELQQEMDNLQQKHTDISTNLDVYEELSGKLDKTEEETQQLKDSTEALVELVPGAVIGYNQYGEAVLDVAAAYDELDKKQREMSANADKQLEQFDNLQKGAQKTGKTWNTVNKILGWTLTIGGAILAPFTGGTSLYASGAGLAMIGGGAWADSVMDEKQIEENRKVWDENYSEILKAYQAKRDEFLLDVADENRDTASKVVDSFISSIMEAGRNGRISDASSSINTLLENLDTVDWSIMDTAKKNLEMALQYDEMSVKEAKNKIDNEVRAQLERAGLTDVQIDGIITAVLNITYQGAADAENLKKQIDDKIGDLEVDGLTDSEKREKQYLENMKEDIGNLTQAELELLHSSGLLRTEFATLFDAAGGMDKILDTYKDEEGQLNKNKAIIGTINDLLEDRENKLNEINKLETDLANSEEKKAVLDYYKDSGLSQKEIDARIKAAEEGRLWENGGGSEIKQYHVGDTNLVKGEKMSVSDAKKEYDILKAYQAKYEETSKSVKKLDGETKTYGETITTLMSQIETYKEPTFGEMADSIKEVQASFQEIKDLLDSLKDSNNIFDLGDIGDLFTILDGYEKMINLSDTARMSTQMYYDALGKINDAVQVQNGQLVAQEGLEQGLYQLSIASAQAKMEELYIQIEQTEAELKYQNAILATEKAAVDAALEALRTNADAAGVEEALKTTQANLETNLAEASIKTEEQKLNARLQAASEFGVKYAKIMREAELGTYEGGVEKIKIDTTAIKKQMSENINKSITDSIDWKDIDGSIAALEKRSLSLQEQIDTNNDIIDSSLSLKKKVADYLKNPTNLANISQVTKDASDAQSEYNEKLERTLTLLEKIEGLQHTIDENETFKSLYDGYDGESVGRILATNLKLSQEQYEVYKDLFDMQQEMTNQAAGDLLDSPYGEMFKIQENGDIGWADPSMYDKYKNMPDDMQEDIDNLVEAYQKQRDALRSTEKDLAKYAQAIKAAREELVEMEIEIENELVDALKNREKIMHDARVKAIEDEIEMIEKAVEARKKAREEDESEKELYQAQEALRRATLDSSGKNNAQLLQLQQDLEDKQLEISEKRFEEDMEDRKNWLQDTKDAETETYEYRLETMTWYWENVQIIQEAGQEAMMQTLIHWNEQYRTTSDLQQREMERKWQETMDAMKAAADMGVELDKLTTDIVDVTKEVESMNISIDKLPGTWQKATNAANNYAAAAKNAANYVSNFKPKTYEKKEEEKKEETKSNKAPSPAGIPKEPGNLTVYELKDGKLTSRKMCAMPTGYDEGAVPFSVGATFRDKDGKTYYKGANGQLYSTKDFKKVYAQGGYVDYTGPAWVDGTSSKPEAFLNAYQTQQVGALAEALDSKSINSANMNSNVTFGSINFNVASMSSAADGKKALEMFVQGANDLMAKKGIGTKLNMNVK